jgi:prolyl-tRNA synthetase
MKMGYEVILDDRKDGYGTKMKDSELIGIPLNIIIGKQFIENNEIELRSRTGESSSNDISNTKTILDFFKNK